MLRHARPLALVGAFGALLGAAGCGSDDNTSSADAPAAATGAPIPEGTIKIGAAIAKTGFLAPYDEGIKTVRLQIEDINAKGGILGHKLELMEADTRSDLQRGSIAAQKLIDDGAQIMLVTCDTSAGAPAAVVATQAKLATFTLCASEPGWNPPAFDNLAFSAFGSIASEAAAGAQFLKDEKGVKAPFLLIDTSLTYGKNACKAYEEYIAATGGKVAGKAEFKNEDTSLAGQISKIRSSKADGVAVCSYPPGGATAIKQIRAAGLEIPAWGPQSFDGTFWLDGLSTLSEFYFTTPGSVFGDDPNEKINKVVEDFLERGAQDTTLLAAYSTMEALQTAITDAESVEGPALKTALEAFEDEPLLIGPTTYTDKIHVPNRDWSIGQVQKGKSSYVSRIKPTMVPELSAQ